MGHLEHHGDRPHQTSGSAVSHSLPIPLGDELALGVLGRYARLNGISSIPWAVKAIRSLFQEDKGFPTLWMLAKACGRKPFEFAVKHSMLPALFPISRYGGTEQEPSGRRRLATAYGFSASAAGLRWCPECARPEQNKREVGHWKRAHQINGIDWCVIHYVPLISVPLDAAIFAPSHAISPAPPDFSPLGLEDELSNRALQRLQHIFLEWLQAPTPLHLRAWSQVVSQRCQKLQIRIGEVGKRSVVSDLILSQFPRTWLSRHLPEVAVKQERSYVRKIDGACVDKHVAYPALACGTILAVLFESAEEALAELTQANQQYLVQLTPAEAAQKALDAFCLGMGIREACQQFGASVEAVEAELRQHYLLSLGA
jgi:hypothetical protein